LFTFVTFFVRLIVSYIADSDTIRMSERDISHRREAMGETSHDQSDTKKDDEQKRVATGIDSIQGGTRVPPAARRHATSGTGAEAQAKNANSTDQNREAQEAKKNASQQSRSRPTEVNSDNDGPVHDGDTAG
jgi:hypothetical protein